MKVRASLRTVELGRILSEDTFNFCEKRNCSKIRSSIGKQLVFLELPQAEVKFSDGHDMME